MGRNSTIDVLRAVAVILVLFHHVPGEWMEGNAVLRALHRGGFCGVDLFFVLSGFLIAGLLFAEQERYGKIAVARFLVRRAFKLYPAFWAMICASVVARLVFGDQESVDRMWRPLAAELLFFQNYVPGLWPHTWTLAVEEHFYIGLSLIFWWMARSGGDLRKDMTVPSLLLICSVCCFLSREWGRQPSVWSDWLVTAGTHRRADSLMFGVFLQWLLRDPHRASFVMRVPTIVFAATGVLLLSTAFWDKSSIRFASSAFDPMLLCLGAGCLVLCSISLRGTSGPVMGWIVMIGADSYSIYLWHMFAFAVVDRGLDRFPSASFGHAWVYFVIPAVVVGIVMSRLVEHPVLRIRDRWFPSRSATSMSSS